ncbi:MAG: HDOD domain-containing protein [Planctomycetota bacterium]
MKTANPSAFIQRIETLPPLPAIVPAILDATTDETASAEHVAEVLRRDPTVAAKVLRVANSPFYSAQREVTDTTRAVIRLGVMAVRNLVVGLCAGSAIRGIGKARESHGLLWTHSVGTAAAAELIAREVDYPLPEEAFIAGLLHDFGQLAMLVTETARFHEVAEQTAKGGMKFLYREREAFGIDHTEAGAVLMRHWGLPAALIDAARHHHTDQAEELKQRPLVAVVVLADTMAQRMGMGMDFTTGTTARTEVALNALGLSNADGLRIAQALPARVTQASDMLQQTDRLAKWANPEEGPVVNWVTESGQAPDDMTRLLLETRGYSVKAIRLDDLGPASDSDLLIFADKHDVCPGRAGIELVPGLRLREDSDNADRFRIPRDFSTFDLAWAEEQLP